MYKQEKEAIDKLRTYLGRTIGRGRGITRSLSAITGPGLRLEHSSIEAQSRKDQPTEIRFTRDDALFPLISYGRQAGLSENYVGNLEYSIETDRERLLTSTINPSTHVTSSGEEYFEEDIHPMKWYGVVGRWYHPAWFSSRIHIGGDWTDFITKAVRLYPYYVYFTPFFVPLKMRVTGLQVVVYSSPEPRPIWLGIYSSRKGSSGGYLPDKRLAYGTSSQTGGTPVEIDILLDRQLYWFGIAGNDAEISVIAEEDYNRIPGMVRYTPIIGDIIGSSENMSRSSHWMNVPNCYVMDSELNQLPSQASNIRVKNIMRRGMPCVVFRYGGSS